MVEFHAVQCFDCSVFQVQQVKRVAKFTCRLCGAKQSVKQVYGISHKASDVRSVVTSLNARRQAADDAADAEWPGEPHSECSAENTEQKPGVDWDAFLEQGQLCDEEEAQHSAGQEEAYVTQLPERRAKRGHGVRHTGVADHAVAQGHVQKRRTQGGSGQQLERLHGSQRGRAMDTDSVFRQRHTLTGNPQPGHAAAHAGTAAGTAACPVDRGGSRWEEFRAELDCDDGQEPLDIAMVPCQHVAHSAWHTSAAGMPDDTLHLVTTYD